MTIVRMGSQHKRGVTMVDLSMMAGEFVIPMLNQDIAIIFKLVPVIKSIEKYLYLYFHDANLSCFVFDNRHCCFAYISIKKQP